MKQIINKIIFDENPLKMDRQILIHKIMIAKTKKEINNFQRQLKIINKHIRGDKNA